jgi:hypothetical protein
VKVKDGMRRDGMGWPQDDSRLVRRQLGARTSHERIFAQDPGSLRPQIIHGGGVLGGTNEKNDKRSQGSP